MEDPWVIHASLIKKLYQDERRTLKEVKTILETEHGFPKKPLSLYEKKLRDTHKLRKKLKAKDWPQIYHYARANGLDGFDLYLNGTLIPWHKVWKEFRRSGVTRSPDSSVPHGVSLPAGVIIRQHSRGGERQLYPRVATSPARLETPSTTLQPHVATSWAVAPTCRNSASVNSSHNSQADRSRGYFASSSQPSVSSHMTRFSHIVARWNLETIPWTKYRLEIASTQTACEESHIDLRTVYAQESFSYPAIWDLIGPCSTLEALPINIDPHHLLAQLVYIFSNGLSHGFSVLELFHSLADRIPQSLMSRIFDNNSLSIRACWREFFYTAAKWWDARALRLLITVALEFHPEWIAHDKDYVLFVAPLIDDDSLVRELLRRGAVPKYYGDLSVFGVAARTGAVKCVQALLEVYGPNATISAKFYTDEVSQSVFTTFLMNFGQRLAKQGCSQLQQPGTIMADYFTILGLMLEAGAKVDSMLPFTVEQYLQERDGEEGCVPYQELDFDMHGPLRCKLTCLDVCFYWNKFIFDQMVPYSDSWETSLTRGGVCLAAAQGIDALEGYLRSRSPPPSVKTRQYLEMVLSEQFLLIGTDKDQRIKVKITRVLIEYGIGIQAVIQEVDSDPEWPLWKVVKAVVSSGLDDDLSVLLYYLLDRGTSLPDSVLIASVSNAGTELLDALIAWNGEDSFGLGGNTALYSAARKRNFDAVSSLLKAGVDINSEITLQDKSLTTLAHIMSDWEDGIAFSDTAAMWQSLVNHGARLRRRAEDKTCFELLEHIITLASKSFKRWKGPWEVFQLLCRSQEDCRSLSQARWERLLLVATNKEPQRPLEEDQERLNLVNALYEQCSLPLSEPFLSRAIVAGCQEHFLIHLIESGQSIHSQSAGLTPLQAAVTRCQYRLVSLLLAWGADANFTPLVGEKRTALQLACNWAPKTKAGMDRQIDLIKLLIENGADVNAPALGAYGATALQLICAREYYTREGADHVDRIFNLLVQNGALANAEPGVCMMTALQTCAEIGDLRKAAALIQQGADPNGHPFVQMGCRGAYGQSSLDMAASWGRLDMTQYLLNVGALSASPGDTGFQGSIDIATRNTEWEVAEAIRMHADRVAEQQSRNLDLLVAHVRCIGHHASALDERRVQYEKWRTDERSEGYSGVE